MKNGKKLFAIATAVYLFVSFFAGCNKYGEQVVEANISVKALYSTEKIEKTEDLSNRADGGVEIAMRYLDAVKAAFVEVPIEGPGFDAEDICFEEKPIE